MKVYLNPMETTKDTASDGVVLNQNRKMQGSACKWTVECPYIGKVSCDKCKANQTKEMGIAEAIVYWREKEK